MVGTRKKEKTMSKMKNVYFEAVKCPVCNVEVKKSSATKALYEVDFLGRDSAIHRCNNSRDRHENCDGR